MPLEVESSPFAGFKLLEEALPVAEVGEFAGFRKLEEQDEVVPEPVPILEQDDPSETPFDRFLSRFHGDGQIPQQRAESDFARGVFIEMERGALTLEAALGHVLSAAPEASNLRAAGESLVASAEEGRQAVEAQREGGFAEGAGEFLGIFFNPLFIGAFRLTGQIGARVYAAIAGKVGIKAETAAVAAGAGAATARRIGSFTEFAAAGGMAGGAGLATVGGITAFAEEGDVAAGAVGAAVGAAEGVLLGIGLGITVRGMFGAIGRVNAKVKSIIDTPMAEFAARRELGLPKVGKLTREQIDAAYKAKAKVVHPDAGGTDEAFAAASKAAETLRVGLEPRVAVARPPSPTLQSRVDSFRTSSPERATELAKQESLSRKDARDIIGGKSSLAERKQILEGLQEETKPVEAEAVTVPVPAETVPARTAGEPSAAPPTEPGKPSEKLVAPSKKELASAAFQPPTNSGNIGDTGAVIPPEHAELFDGGAAFDIPSEGTMAFLVRKTLDEMKPLLDVQTAIGPLPDSSNAYLQQTLFPSKVMKRVKDLERNTIKPIINEMNRLKLSLTQVDEYLMARHAPDRNARIAKINPDLEGPGSGMSNEQAAEILAAFKQQGLSDKLERVAQMVYRATRTNLAEMVRAGLLPQKVADQWQENMGPRYVTLKHDPEGDSLFNIGRKFDIRGKESKSALGRTTLADSPLGNTFGQLVVTAVRAEKAFVGQAMLELVKENPNPDLWEIDKKTRKPVLDKETGLVKFIHDKQARLADNVFAVKSEGKEHLITFKTDQGKLVAKAMNGMGAAHGNQFVRVLQKVNRYFAMVNTSLNPEFVLSNFMRDIQTAAFVVTADRGKKIARRIVSNTIPAIKGSMDALRNPEATGKWADTFRDFEGSGGRVGWYHMLTLEERLGQIEAMSKNIDPTKSRQVLLMMQSVFQYVDDLNAAVENGVRVAAYQEFLDLGESKARAAFLAKNLTVNFNRKGELGHVFNALFLFANATGQGGSRVYKTLQTPVGKRIAAGAAAFGFVLPFINRLLAGDDDDGRNRYDKIPAWVKERNLILMAPGTGGAFVTIPLPYGFSFFYTIGERSNAMVFDEEVGPGEAMLDVWEALLGSFNPLGSGGGIVQLLTPTVPGDLLVQLYTNEKFNKTPVRPEQAHYGVPIPASELAWRSTRPTSKALASAVNSFTLFGEGDGDVEEGLISTSPANLDHIFNTLTGGAGKTVSNFASTVTKVAMGEAPPVRTVPFLRRFLQMPDERVVSQDYYDFVGERKLRVDQWKRYKVAGRDAQADRILRQNAGVMRSNDGLKRAEARIQELNGAIRKEQDDDRREELREKRLSLQKRYNKAFRSLKFGKKSAEVSDN